MKISFANRGSLVTAGLVFSVAVWLIWNGTSTTRSLNAAQPAVITNQEIAALQAEVNRLKGMVPDQSHAMKDVAYHFANLWFAGEKKNWPLADFYWSETRSHLRWAVRIIPIRKDPQGHEIRLSEILDPIDAGALESLHKTIIAKDADKFSEAYKQMLDGCYACHLASGKPYLRLQIPQQPEAAMIRFDPMP
jgi:hypothetical protein